MTRKKKQNKTWADMTDEEQITWLGREIMGYRGMTKGWVDVNLAPRRKMRWINMYKENNWNLWMQVEARIMKDKNLWLHYAAMLPNGLTPEKYPEYICAVTGYAECGIEGRAATLFWAKSAIAENASLPF